MADTGKSSWIREILVSLATAALIGLFSLVPGGWSWLFSLPGAIWAHLGRSTAMPNWALYLLGATAVFALGYLVAAIAGSREPEWKSYVEDHFLGVPWRWNYAGSRIHEPWAFCPACDTTLVYEEHYGGYNLIETVHLFCERCNVERLHHQGRKSTLVGMISRQIERNIRTGDWRKAKA